ncbi:Transcriptional regulator, contains XRE-family HTH domain [Sporobacter termitidis DSM 10068]|uniref:Transcriptional regulator, contains XRE-family HTH domain n=1 Tax=Sporobacter termitidis DSM 10068 TaxID=1123282 RepID=A0A1M5WDS5_9FIRM|nr:helix-turn-helix transcriptional regulator [Sporobacter termitidis]SHH85642.1 Transcriptional regulator, contains XRE-family HTH domain [Sporobacter termitidis DSM 10068]
MTLGEKLLYLRKKKGLSQEQLAAQVTVSRQAISKWELGESLPDTENIVQLTKIFAVSADFLLNDEVDIPNASTENVNQEKDIIQSLLEKEVKDEADRFALKAYNQKSKKRTWMPILFSGLTIVLIAAVYLLFFR